MKPYQYIHINLQIALESQLDGRINARIVEQLPTIDVDTGVKQFAHHSADNDHARAGEAVIIVDD
jgi:hypothetical protein